MTERPLVKGNGTFTEVKPGVYQYYHSMGKDPVTGKYLKSPKRTIHTTSIRAVERALDEYKDELNSGIIVKNTSRTVGAYAQYFHSIRKGAMPSPLAYERESYDVKHINELLGNCRIKALRPSDIRRTYAEAMDSGRFSAMELNRVHMKLKQVLQSAVDDGLISKNPCDGITMPRPKGHERSALSAEEASRLFSCLLKSKPCAHIVAVLLMLDTGMRRGEALGMTWENMDLANGVALIVQQYTNDKTLRAPKSETSNRRISLTEATCSYLARWKTLQREELEGYALGQSGQTPLVHSVCVVKDDHGGKTTRLTHLDPHNFNRWFRNWCVDNGFGTYKTVTKTFKRDGVTHYRGKDYEGLFPHMLRHTQATLLIGADSDVKTVQARLGHSSSNLTLDLYSHAIAANDRKAAKTFEGLIAPGQAK